MKIIFLLFLLFPALVFAHGGALDNQGGHFNRKNDTYHCHKQPCFSIHKQAEEAYQEADPNTYSKIYNRKTGNTGLTRMETVKIPATNY